MPWVLNRELHELTVMLPGEKAPVKDTGKFIEIRRKRAEWVVAHPSGFLEFRPRTWPIELAVVKATTVVACAS